MSTFSCSYRKSGPVLHYKVFLTVGILTIASCKTLELHILVGPVKITFNI